MQDILVKYIETPIEYLFIKQQVLVHRVSKLHLMSASRIALYYKLFNLFRDNNHSDSGISELDSMVKID